MVDEIFDYPAYLSAKKSVDDLSLNKHVWTTLCHWLKKRQGYTTRIKILEIGAGIGTMIERIIDQDILTDCEYTAIEQEPEFKDHAYQRLSAICNSAMNMENEKWTIKTNNYRFTINWINGDAMELDHILIESNYDLVISHAVIDLLPVPVFLPTLFTHLSPGAGYYFSLNFSGKTEFLPSLENDEIIYREYHNDMDSRFKKIDWQPSLTGQLLSDWLIDNGHNIIATGPSDWKLNCNENESNSLFIANILQTIEKALSDLPELDAWLIQRRKQLDSNELSFSASNIDYFGVITKFD